MHKLATASENSVSLDELLAYFYKADKETKHKRF